MNKANFKIIYVWLTLLVIIISLYLIILPRIVDDLIIEDIVCYERGVLLSWKNDDSQRFCIYRKTNNEKWEPIAYSNESSYYDEELIAGNTYNYGIQCVDRNNNKLSRLVKGEKDIFYGGIIDIISYTVDDSIKIEWNSVEISNGYEVLRKVKGESWEQIASVQSDINEYYDRDVLPEGEYAYSIRLQGKEYEECYNHMGTEVVKCTTPIIASMRYSSEGICVRWNEPQYAQKYCVYRKANDEKEWKFIRVVEDTVFVDGDVSVGNMYKYAIRCIDGDEKNFTSSIDGDSSSIFICETPFINEVRLDGDNIHISWDEVNNAEKYRLFVKIDSKGGYKIVDTLDKNVCSYEYLDAELGHSYMFTLRCVSDDGRMYTSLYNDEGIIIDY